MLHKKLYHNLVFQISYCCLQENSPVSFGERKSIDDNKVSITKEKKRTLNVYPKHSAQKQKKTVSLADFIYEADC